MAGFPLQFDAEMDADIERISRAAGMKKRPWVMSLIHKAIKDADAPKAERVLKLWHFRLNSGDVLSHHGDSPGAAWQSLGYKLDEMELVDEHWSTRYNAPEEPKVWPSLRADKADDSALKELEMGLLKPPPDMIQEPTQEKEWDLVTKRTDSADELSFFHT